MNYNGIFKEQIEAFILEKRSLGYKYIREENGKELDLGEALKRQLTSNRNEVYACHLSGTWACVDTPEKYLEAQKIFMCMNGKINY